MHRRFDGLAGDLGNEPEALARNGIHDLSGGWPCKCSGGYKHLPYGGFADQFVSQWDDEWDHKPHRIRKRI
jgi:hypothetical protein